MNANVGAMEAGVACLDATLCDVDTLAVPKSTEVWRTSVHNRHARALASLIEAAGVPLRAAEEAGSGRE